MPPSAWAHLALAKDDGGFRPLLSDPALAATTRGPVYLLIISSSIVCLSFDTLWCPWGNCIVSRMTPMTKVLRSTPRTCCPYI